MNVKLENNLVSAKGLERNNYGANFIKRMYFDPPVVAPANLMITSKLLKSLKIKEEEYDIWKICR